MATQIHEIDHKISQLTALLEEEAAGQAIDARQACDLAHRLGHLSPEISRTMQGIIARLSLRQSAAA